jgi:hypothetical protein
MTCRISGAFLSSPSPSSVACPLGVTNLPSIPIHPYIQQPLLYFRLIPTPTAIVLALIASVKGIIYEDYLTQPEQARNRFYPDANHANADGHDLIADVLISYIMSQICAGWSTIQGQSFDTPLFGMDETSTSGPSLLGGVGLRKGMPGQQPGDGESVDENGLISKYQALKVPQGRMADRPVDAKQFREIEPFCVAASDLINPLPPSLFYGSGWKEYHPPKYAMYEDRHYW